MNKDNEIKKYTTIDKKYNNIETLEASNRINRQNNNLISCAQFKRDTDNSLYSNLQAFWDENFDRCKYPTQNQIQSGKVIIEDDKHISEIIFEGGFETIGNYTFTAQTEKIKDILEERLITQYQQNQNPTLYINLKDLAKELYVTAFNLRKKIIYVMEGLQTIRVSYKTKGKLKKNNFFTDFASLRIISSSEYHADTDILEVNFDNKYAYIISIHNFFQLPKKYKKINDNTYPYAYPLAKYINELYRNNRNKITFKTLYNKIKKIPRIEDVRKHQNSITQKIYEPLQKHFNILNSIGDFIIQFENEDFLLINSNKNINFEKMLETNIIINWLNPPDYGKIANTKEKIRNKIIKERERAYLNASNKKQIK